MKTRVLGHEGSYASPCTFVPKVRGFVLASGPGHGWPSGLLEGLRCVELLQCWGGVW
jgi:hypothetical protein